MKSVEALITFILAALKDEEGGRVALYHYLKHFVPVETEVTPALINGFFAEALQLPHWQSKKETLHSDIQELLQRYCASTGEPFRLDQVWDLSRMQIVAIENPENLGQTVLEAEQALKKEGENLRIFLESKTRVVAIRRLTDGSMIVHGYNQYARIVGNRLVPLGTDQDVRYDTALELASGFRHRLRTSPNSQIQFYVEPRDLGSALNVKFIAGYAFRETQNLKVPSIHHEPRLFYPLKRLEKFYVHRPSDPYYIEIMSTLDTAMKMLQTDAEGAQSFALEAFDIGQIAFDQVFSDDKAIYQRLKELAKFINWARRTETSSPKEVTL